MATWQLGKPHRVQDQTEPSTLLAEVQVDRRSHRKPSSQEQRIRSFAFQASHLRVTQLRRADRWPFNDRIRLTGLRRERPASCGSFLFLLRISAAAQFAANLVWLAQRTVFAPYMMPADVSIVLHL